MSKTSSMSAKLSAMRPSVRHGIREVYRLKRGTILSMRVILLSNPSSGPASSTVTWLDSARSRLGQRLGRWTEWMVRPGEDIVSLAREAQGHADLLIVSGGDGTVRAAAEGLQNSGLPLGILPTGTVNVLARELGIPLTDPEAAMDICLGESERCIDMGLCNGRPYLLVCSGGVDSATVQQVNTDLKSAVGATAYAVAAIGALATFTPPLVWLTIDGERLPPTEVFLVAVGNASLYGGDLRLLPDATIDDGLLDVALFQAPVLPAAVRNAAFLPQMADTVLGRQRQNEGIRLFQGSRVTLESAPPIPLQMDGDLVGTTPAVFTVAPQALRVKAPPKPL